MRSGNQIASIIGEFLWVQELGNDDPQPYTIYDISKREEFPIDLTDIETYMGGFHLCRDTTGWAK